MWFTVYFYWTAWLWRPSKVKSLKGCVERVRACVVWGRVKLSGGRCKLKCVRESCVRTRSYVSATEGRMWAGDASGTWLACPCPPPT